jgi:hypothetical protein
MAVMLVNGSAEVAVVGLGHSDRWLTRGRITRSPNSHGRASFRTYRARLGGGIFAAAQ